MCFETTSVGTMQLLKFLKINYRTILNYSWRIFAAFLTVSSPFQGSYFQGTLKSLLAEVLLCVLSVGAAYVYIWRKNQNTITTQSTTKINVVYGDIFKIAFSEGNKQDIKRIVVIPVNTCFDTIVDEDIALVKKPLVSPTSIHGQWIKQVSKTLHIGEIDKRIADSLKDEPFTTIKIEQKRRGNLKDYDYGTVAVFDYASTEFFLLALARFDSNNNAQCSKDEFLLTVKKLIVFIDKHGQGLPVYIPLMGTNLSRANMTHKESLQAMVALMRLYSEKLKSEVNIVVYDGDREKVSIYDVV